MSKLVDKFARAASAAAATKTEVPTPAPELERRPPRLGSALPMHGAIAGAQVQKLQAEANELRIQLAEANARADGLKALADERADAATELISLNDRIQSLKTQLSNSEAAVNVLAETSKHARAGTFLDSKDVHHSKFANRTDSSFKDQEFAELKAEIANSGGNVQPIKVRPLAAGGYEIVFGHRRHRACLELGLPVRATIEEINDRQLFVEMDRENRARKNLTAFEQGLMYRKALDLGLYPSNKQLAEALNEDVGKIGKALVLASLPVEVLSLFSSPAELQFRWSKPFSDLGNDELSKRAKHLQKRSTDLSSKEIFELLTSKEEKGVEPFIPPEPTRIEIKGKGAVTISFSKTGAGSVSFEPGLLSPKLTSELADLLKAFLREK